MFPYFGAAVAAALWTAANAKTSRSDGTLIKNVHPYRRLLFFVMPTRNESVVYWDEYYDAEKLTKYLGKANERFQTNYTHAIIAAVATGLRETPGVNRFVKGRRLYQRDGVHVTFSMKRKKKNTKAKLSAVKMRMDEGETFRELSERINSNINRERSGKKTYSDKEYDIFNLLPRPLLDTAAKALRWLDFHNLLPSEFIRTDGMYTSVFVANLGSLGMTAGHHHLYEWGNCPLFLMFGKVEDRAVVIDGKVVARKMFQVRVSFDERVNDALTCIQGMQVVRRVLEDPEQYLGCLAADGSDTHPYGKSSLSNDEQQNCVSAVEEP